VADTISLKPGAERLTRVAGWAAERGLNRHAALLALIDLGLEGLKPETAEALERIRGIHGRPDAEAVVAHLIVGHVNRCEECRK
jgi:hypothetical protein